MGLVLRLTGVTGVPLQTKCPLPLWTAVMRDADPSPNKVIVSIGCNKGDDIIGMLAGGWYI